MRASLERVNTVERVGSLEVVADAFAAVDAAGLVTPRDSLSAPGEEPVFLPVRRVDTLELLAFPVHLRTIQP